MSVLATAGWFNRTGASDWATWLSSVFGMVPSALLAPRDGSPFVSDQLSGGMSPRLAVASRPESLLANGVGCGEWNFPAHGLLTQSLSCDRFLHSAEPAERVQISGLR